jgi:hypothetical protein
MDLPCFHLAEPCVSAQYQFSNTTLAVIISSTSNCMHTWNKNRDISKAIPVQARGLQEVEAPRIFRQSAHEGGKSVSPKHRPPLPARENPWYSFLS